MKNIDIKTPQGFWQAILSLTGMIRQATLIRSADRGGVYKQVKVSVSGDLIELMATDTYSLGRIFISAENPEEFLASAGLPHADSFFYVSGADVWDARSIISSKKTVPTFSFGTNAVKATSGEKTAEIEVGHEEDLGVFPNPENICLTTNKGTLSRGSAAIKSASFKTSDLAGAVSEIASVPNTKAEISQKNRQVFLAANGHLKFCGNDIYTTEAGAFSKVRTVGRLLQNCPEDLFMVMSAQKLHDNMGVFALCEKGHFYATSETKPICFVGKTDDVVVEVVQMPLRLDNSSIEAKEHMVG